MAEAKVQTATTIKDPGEYCDFIALLGLTAQRTLPDS
jgi:hypothetical protein